MILHRTPLVALLALPNSNMREEKWILVLVVKIVSCIQSLMGFRVPWAVFRFPKPRIPDSTNKTDIPDSRIPIPLRGAIKEVIVQNCKWLIAVKRNKMDANLPKHNLQTCSYLLGWLLHKSLIKCFWHVRRLTPFPARGLKQADQFQCLY